MAEPEPNELSFEGAMERLEAIVEAMESGRLPLEEMLERYEEGSRMVKLCSEKLAAAEKRIEIITRNASGKPETAAFEPGEPASPEPPKAAPRRQPKPPAPPAGEDVSLF